MTKDEMSVFLAAAIGTCAVGGLLNLLLVRKRGAAAILMAIAFLLLGGTLSLYRANGPSFLFNAGVVLVLTLLVAHFLMSAKKARPGP
ncbi:MAG TPA: hypothetical protein VG944_03730 [Fimbriimonas sp.]|nr:hypothetical protein [Fimbriimonas sp.]